MPGGSGRAKSIPQKVINSVLIRLVPRWSKKNFPLGLTQLESRCARGIALENNLAPSSGSRVFFLRKEGSQNESPKNIRIETSAMTIPNGMLSPGRGIGSKKGNAKMRVTKAWS